MIGPGKYDDECTELRDKIKGEIVLLVVDGIKGTGFAVQMSLINMGQLPKILRSMADSIEYDYKKIIENEK